jgi:hypothetical protein
VNASALNLVERMYGQKANELFDIVNPKGDGNYGFYVAQLFNEFTGREVAMTNTKFRHQLAAWMIEHEEDLVTHCKYAQLHPLFGETLITLRDQVYQEPGVNFDSGCDTNFWWDYDLFGIVAQIYKFSVVCFVSKNLGPAYIKSDGVNVIMATASELPHPSTEDEGKILSTVFIKIFLPINTTFFG